MTFLFLLFFNSPLWAQGQISVTPEYADAEVKSQLNYVKKMVAELEAAKEELEKFRKLAEVLDGPALQTVMRVVQAPEVQATAADVFDKEKWKSFFIFQLIGVILVTLFRTWKSTQAKSFFSKLWVSCYSYVIYMAVAFYVIPVFVFGQGYRTLLVEVVRAAWA